MRPRPRSTAGGAQLAGDGAVTAARSAVPMPDPTTGGEQPGGAHLTHGHAHTVSCWMLHPTVSSSLLGCPVCRRTPPDLLRGTRQSPVPSCEEGGPTSPTVTASRVLPPHPHREQLGEEGGGKKEKSFYDTVLNRPTQGPTRGVRGDPQPRGHGGGPTLHTTTPPHTATPPRPRAPRNRPHGCPSMGTGPPAVPSLQRVFPPASPGSGLTAAPPFPVYLPSNGGP